MIFLLGSPPDMLKDMFANSRQKFFTNRFDLLAAPLSFLPPDINIHALLIPIFGLIYT